MKIEYLTDENGNQKAVVIPISDWKKFFSEYTHLKSEAKVENNKISTKQKINTDEVFGMWKDDFEDKESSEDIQRRWRKEQWG